VIVHVRFHLDENVALDIATALRRHGIDVTTTQEVHVRTESDATQWEYAQRESRIVVTHDADFLIIAAQYSEHAGSRTAASGAEASGRSCDGSSRYTMTIRPTMCAE
jgi:hypothetical protein